MTKYLPELTSVVMEEIPDRVTLAVEISNCRGNCPGCHSPFLRNNIGQRLTPQIISDLVSDNFGVNCFLFLGEGKDPKDILALAEHVRSLGLSPALYSGRKNVPIEFWQTFDYLKLGPYIEELGPLNSRSTNQRLYRALSDTEEGDCITRGGRRFTDITHRFWHRGIESLGH